MKKWTTHEIYEVEEDNALLKGKCGFNKKGKKSDNKNITDSDIFFKGVKQFVDSSHNNVAHVSLFKHKRPTRESTKFLYGKQAWLKDRKW